MIRVEEARRQILAAFSPLGLERVSILDALGRVIGEDVFAGRNIPSVDKSSMDGYALRREDTLGASPENPAILEVTEVIPAGAMPTKPVGPGQAARIMTGAPIPAGADAVVPLEEIRTEGDRVCIFVETAPGQDIRHAGDDVRQGEKVIPRGTVIRPAAVGMLASLGRSIIPVHQRPLVSILSTGDELVEIDAPSSPELIVNSNSYALAALVRDCGATPLMIGIARDRREDLEAAFGLASRGDLIISTGGVSGGDYDLVKEILQGAGNHLEFWKIAMRPGRSLAFGRLGTVPVIGLPGTPAAAMIAFEQFIRPAILKMMGHTNLFRRTVPARIEEAIKKKSGVRHFIRALICRDDEGYAVVPIGKMDTGALRSMVGANGLIILSEDATSVKAGDMVKVQLLDDSLERTPEAMPSPIPGQRQS